MILSHIQMATAVALIVGYFAAHAAGILTHVHAPDWVLGAVTVVLGTLAGVLPTIVWNENDSWKVYLGNVFVALVAATLAHRSKIPEALRRGTGSGIGRRRSINDAGYGLIEVCLAALVIIVILILVLHNL
jgi:hypothetical protein